MKDYEHVVIWLDYFNKTLPRNKGRKLTKEKCIFDTSLKELLFRGNIVFRSCNFDLKGSIPLLILLETSKTDNSEVEVALALPILDIIIYSQTSGFFILFSYSILRLVLPIEPLGIIHSNLHMN